jgi:hypothetical protein
MVIAKISRIGRCSKSLKIVSNKFCIGMNSKFMLDIWLDLFHLADRIADGLSVA